MTPLSLTDIKEILKASCTYLGNTSLVFDGFGPIMECTVSHISWIRPNNKKAAYFINNTKAGCVICNQDTFNMLSGIPADILYIITSNPLFALVQILNKVKDSDAIEGQPLIHPSAIIHPGCTLGTGVKIGPYCILDKCAIGDNTMIGNNVRIHNNVVIGKNCEIREFCSVGGAGFGIAKDENGDNLHMPHIGGVIIGDNVLLFPYANVDKGGLGNTVIENNVVIDHYAHIGHNTFTGKNTIITAGVVLAGGSKVGNNCFLGVHTVVKEKVEIGSYVTTGMGAVVIRNIPDNQTWVGNPAKEINKSV